VKFQVQSMRGVKKLVADAVRGDPGAPGPTIAERARALRADGRADEAARLVARSTGMREDEAKRFVEALD
jgi:hypothetical protein